MASACRRGGRMQESSDPPNLRARAPNCAAGPSMAGVERAPHAPDPVQKSTQDHAHLRARLLFVEHDIYGLEAEAADIPDHPRRLLLPIFAPGHEAIAADVITPHARMVRYGHALEDETPALQI